MLEKCSFCGGDVAHEMYAPHTLPNGDIVEYRWCDRCAGQFAQSVVAVGLWGDDA